MKERPRLTSDEAAVYEWQMWTAGFGEAGQEALKGASVLISRCGGVGGSAAYQLAAAGLGRLVIAHAGAIKPSDLNRQLLMTHDKIGTLRVESAAGRLRELNPRLAVEAMAENVSEENAERLVGRADVVIDCAPLFEERFLLNREAVRQRKPMVEAAMRDFEAHLTTFLPGRTPCLACLYPELPPWKRQFPVFGAVSGAIGSLAALEAIKLITGVAEPLAGRLLTMDLREMAFRTFRIERNPACRVCGG
jgi:molybdopterin/thiamine biosynthesis adenylyltransferase